MTSEPMFLFIVGTGRCGSTLVQEVLSRHPDVGFVSNIDNALPALNLKGRLNNPAYRTLPVRLAGRTTRGERPGWGRASSEAAPGPGRGGRLRFAPSEGYRLLGRRVSQLVVSPTRDLTAQDAAGPIGPAFHRFFEERAVAQRRPVFIHHFTGWPRAAFINAVLPEARFVHVVRDGRAVAASLLRMPWWRGREGPEHWGFGPLPPILAEAWEVSGRSPLFLAALQWKLLIEAAARARLAVAPDRWLEVRYEDLVSRPREHVARMLDHAGLEWGPRFERQFVRCSFPAVRVDAFRREFDSAELRMIEAILAGTLTGLGYPVGGDGPPPAVSARQPDDRAGQAPELGQGAG